VNFQKNLVPNAQKIEIDFTDDPITCNAGSVFLSQIAEALGLPTRVQRALKIKKRNRGATDSETIMSMIYSLAQGNGSLSDLDRLKADESQGTLLGL